MNIKINNVKKLRRIKFIEFEPLKILPIKIIKKKIIWFILFNVKCIQLGDTFDNCSNLSKGNPL